MNEGPKIPPPPVLPKRPDNLKKPRTLDGMKPPPVPPAAAPAPPPPPPPLPGKPGEIRVGSGGMLGAILVDNGFMTHEQCQHCLAVQSKSRDPVPLGEIAVRLGYITRATLELALAAQKDYQQHVRAEQSKMIPLTPELLAEMEAELEAGSPSLIPLEPEPEQEAGLEIELPPALRTEPKPVPQPLDQPRPAPAPAPAPVPEKTSPRTEATRSKLVGWLAAALGRKASDLHVMTGKPLVMRHAGKLLVSKQSPIPAEAIGPLLTSILDGGERAALERDRAIVKCVDLPDGGRARCNIFHHLKGVNGAFRLVPAEIPTLVTLNLPPAVGKFTTYAQGLVLITGPISSGKTTTMAALLDIINQERNEHIITVESPIEFVIPSRRSLVTQRQIGLHTESYAHALRAALREDPDVIAVGELNDLETARLAITAAETGHLVIATLHTSSAVRSLSRLIDIFPPDEQAQVRNIVAESLRGVISQRLVTRADAPGVVPVVEVLVTTPAVRNLIHERKLHQLKNAMQMTRDAGNTTFDEQAQKLLEKGFISKETHERILQG